MTSSSCRRVLSAAAVIFFAGAGVFGTQAEQDARPANQLRRSWPGPDGEPLAFETIDQITEFLETAEIVSSEVVAEGINDTRKVLLRRGDLQMHGAFRDVSVTRRRMRTVSGEIRLNFRDEAIFECAAFELARLLDFHFVPPAVRREYRGRRGTLQMWTEGAVSEKQLRRDDDFAPADPWLWSMQHQMMLIFDNLIYNDDRNLGNILYLPDGKLVLIDHTRAFRNFDDLKDPDPIRYCERAFFEALKKVDRATLERRLSPFLTTFQIDAVDKRRLKLIERIEALIAERGEKSVLFSFYRVEN